MTEKYILAYPNSFITYSSIKKAEAEYDYVYKRPIDIYRLEFVKMLMPEKKRA